MNQKLPQSDNPVLVRKPLSGEVVGDIQGPQKVIVLPRRTVAHALIGLLRHSMNFSSGLSSNSGLKSGWNFDSIQGPCVTRIVFLDLAGCKGLRPDLRRIEPSVEVVLKAMRPCLAIPHEHLRYRVETA